MPPGFAAMTTSEPAVSLQCCKRLGRHSVKAKVIGKDIGHERFQCNIMQIIRKRITISAFYTLEGTVLNSVDHIKYLGIILSNDLKWNTYVMSAIFGQRLIGYNCHFQQVKIPSRKDNCRSTCWVQSRTVHHRKDLQPYNLV